MRAGEGDAEDCTGWRTRRTITYEWWATTILGRAAPVAVTTLTIEPRMIAGEFATLLFCDVLGSFVISVPLASNEPAFSVESLEAVCLWFALR